MPVLRRAERAGARSPRRSATVAVAGSHGKTTTSSMLALILRAAGWRSELHHRRRPQRGRHQRRLRRGRVAGGRSRRERRHLPRARARGRDRHQRRARPPRPLRRLRRRSSPRFDEFLAGVPGRAHRVRRRSRRRATRCRRPRGGHLRLGRRGRLPDRRATKAVATGSRFAARRARASRSASIELPVPGPAQRRQRGRRQRRLALELGVAVRGRRPTPCGGFGGVARRFQFRGELDGVDARRRLRPHPRRDRRRRSSAATRGWLAARASRCSSPTGTRAPRACGATSPTRSPAPTRSCSPTSTPRARRRSRACRAA